VNFEVEETGLGAEHGGSFWFGDQGESVIVLVAQESCLYSSSPCRSFASIVPDGRYGQEIADIPLFSRKNFTQSLLEIVAHGLAQLEEVVGSDIDF